eukprot:CAMPEP_0194072790 /NCGR_PEP_ID=MMETSP0149-20130528/431_1 /TAXON_ID=122233 /ORGANISM="Chaetoceros debilis, Strain MM31A-1" /LENGTH=65 /DNA_ID=CAMNT_0038752699 /DNA_START=86 /DNA_END=283 /DNA_ORIENTATION=+
MFSCCKSTTAVVEPRAAPAPVVKSEVKEEAQTENGSEQAEETPVIEDEEIEQKSGEEAYKCCGVY